MPNFQKVQESLDKIINALFAMKDAFKEEGPSAEPAQPKKAHQPPEVKSLAAAGTGEDYGSFEALKKALQSDKWPEAVNPNLICDPDNEADKVERGRGIIELMIEEDLKGLKILDIGCGEGHTVSISTEYGTAMSVGYDIVENERWSGLAGDKQNVLYTTDFEKVKEQGPFDVIVIFDVLDHLKGEAPASLLEKAKSVLSENGKIYVRCHPFTSRHATHLYHDINKAYVHLVFSDEELAELVPESKYREDSIRVIYPVKTYTEFVEQAGLKIANRRDITERVEPFFKIPKIAERIMKNCNTQKFPDFQLTLQFIDFVLKKQ